MKIDLGLQEIEDCVCTLRWVADDLEKSRLILSSAIRRIERYRNIANKLEVLIECDEYPDEGIAEITAHEECTDNDDF